MYKLLRTSFVTDKMELKRNNIKLGNFKLSPVIKRKTGKIKDKLYFTALSLTITSTEEHPFPVDIKVLFRAVFEFSEIDNEEEIDQFLKLDAVRTMFPYLRTITTNLSVTAMMPPIILPIIDTDKLFVEKNQSILIN
ncbi:MAG: protein-export chaperone SecB [Tenericutes bacterium]|nr:protein-export chaperone SecB [Mycoplasmatota bacterium]